MYSLKIIEITEKFKKKKKHREKIIIYVSLPVFLVYPFTPGYLPWMSHSSHFPMASDSGADGTTFRSAAAAVETGVAVQQIVPR